VFAREDRWVREKERKQNGNELVHKHEQEQVKRWGWVGGVKF